MQRLMTERIAFLGIAFLLSQAGLAVAQTDENSRPRFLIASSSPASKGAVGALVPADVERIPVLGKRIALDLDGATLETALAAIADRAKLELLYGDQVLPPNRRVRLQAATITVAAALTDVLLGTGLDVVFNQEGGASLVKSSVAKRRSSAAVSGQVVSKETGTPIVGANVTLALPDSTIRTVTRDSGMFQFANVPTGEHTMTVRYIGYLPFTKKIVVGDLPVEVSVVLEGRPVTLNELVTTATGQQRRRDIGNSITTIRADSVMQTAPIRNIADLLENRVPGLTVQRTSGAPGDPARLRLRGISSVARGNDPIVVVDGVRIYSAQSDARSGNLTTLAPQIGATDAINLGNVPAPSPLDQIDMNTVEKVEVIKGASAATLYGADAANGVIVITTKKGRPGPTRWDARIEHGRTDTPGHWPEGYFKFGHTPQLGGGTQFCTVLDFACIQDSLVRFQALNDPDLTVLGSGRRTALSLTATGGSQSLTYSITGSYNDETGLLKLPTFERERFRNNFNREAPDWMQRPWQYGSWNVGSVVTAILGPTADVTLATSLGRSDQQRTNLENRAAALAGYYVDQVNGFYYAPGELNNTSTADRPFRMIVISQYLKDYYVRTTASALAFTTGLTLKWQPRPWLRTMANAGLNAIPRDDEALLPTGLISPTDSGGLVRGTGRSLLSTFNLQGTARKQLKWGFVFETSVGANLNTTRTDDLISSAIALQPGTTTLVGARLITATERRSNISSFGWYIEPRIIGQRLSLSTGIRLDGGSAYGARLTRSGGLGSLLSLPKLNGSWVISEEPWFPFSSLFSSLQLRAAYGQAQVQPGATDRLRIYTERNTALEQQLDLTTLGNIDIKPERSVEFEGGFLTDILDSRVSLDLNFYRKTQVDALMTVSLPLSVNGGGSVIQNIGKIRNTGFELSATVVPVRSPSLTWSASLIYDRNTNMLVELGRGVQPNKRQGLVAGYPVQGRWARPILGYADEDGNGVIQRNEIQVGDSLVYMGQLLPDYRTSLSTNVALFGGAVGISASFSYDAGATQIDETLRRNWVLVRALADPSAPLDEQASVLASGITLYGLENAVISEPTDYGLIQDVSTFRFNSLAVNYRVPVGVARLLRAQSMTVGISGSNLGLHSTYDGKDPNVTSWSAGEITRDTGQLPTPRTWQLQVFLQY